MDTPEPPPISESPDYFWTLRMGDFAFVSARKIDSEQRDVWLHESQAMDHRQKYALFPLICLGMMFGPIFINEMVLRLPESLVTFIFCVSFLALVVGIIPISLFVFRGHKRAQVLNLICRDELLLRFEPNPWNDSEAVDDGDNEDLPTQTKVRYALVSWPSCRLIESSDQKVIECPKVDLTLPAPEQAQAYTASQFARYPEPGANLQFRDLTSVETWELKKYQASVAYHMGYGAPLRPIFIFLGLRGAIDSNIYSKYVGLATFGLIALSYFLPGKITFGHFRNVSKDCTLKKVVVELHPSQNLPCEYLLNSKLLWTVEGKPAHWRRISVSDLGISKGR